MSLVIKEKKVRPIAFYLPQYHPVPENDEWWGKGFTEWTNVTKSKPLFKNHYQPHYPADLGYYDLRVPEIREQQSQMALDYGLEGFVYYHYWFGNGKQILERPFNEVLSSKKPDVPFCLCWANETWSGIWFGKSKTILMKQHYPGKEDYVNHFNYLLKAFQDDRYIKVNGKPVFVIYQTLEIPDLKEFVDTFRELAHKAGLKGLHLVANRCPLDWNPTEHGLDGVIGAEFHTMRYITAPLLESKDLKQRILRKARKIIGEKFNLDVETRDSPIVVNYETAIEHFITKKEFSFNYYPTVIPNWDNSPRAGNKSVVLHNSTPELFKKHLAEGIDKVKNLDPQNKIVFIKSWNEWAEGNYLEPDVKFGYEYLKVVKELVYS
jgi:hypothetical protein